ncbi:MAG: SDR family NAD(P)-dependent oxidoreductase, partial [Anaerolineales bacterium]|nr:SDR family NAD(P)-dependent oxidoreductase [Anaerolineales bacterium]
MDGSKRLERFSLENRVAIITGGAGFLGAHYCHSLAEFGAHVVIADIEGDAAIELARQISEESGVEAFAYATDVSDPNSVRDMVAATLE